MIPSSSTRDTIANAIVDCLREPLSEEAFTMLSWDACVESYEMLYLAAVKRARCVS
jgi:hypothetical protein